VAIQVENRAIIDVVGRAQHGAQCIRWKIEVRPEIDGVARAGAEGEFSSQSVRVGEWPRGVVTQQAGTGSPGGIVEAGLLKLPGAICIGEIVFPGIANGNQSDAFLSQDGCGQGAG
jgi:hypothetical protein